MTPKEKKIYWRGFEAGKRNSLKHNLVLIKAQLKSQRDFLKEKKK